MTITNKPVNTLTTEIWVDAEGFLRVRSAEGCEVDLEECMRCFAAYRQLGYGPTNKTFQLIDGSKHYSLSKEAREYAAIHGKDYFYASAIITKLLSMRLVVNFFNRFYKHEVLFKLFATEEEALKWLREQRSKLNA